MKDLNTMFKILFRGIVFPIVLMLSNAGSAMALSIEHSDFGQLAVEINFDDLSSGTFVDNLYLSSGVSFDNALANAGSHPVSSPNVIISSDGAPIAIRFQPGAIRAGVQIDTDGYLDRQPQMRVFDVDGNLLGIQNFGQGPDFVGFEFPDTLITTIQLGTTPYGDPMGSFGFSDAYDNLIFELVPEPTTLFLMGFGLVGMIIGFRRRGLFKKI